MSKPGALLLCAMAATCATSSLQACGPFFPNRLLVDGEAAVQAVPTAVFAEEVRRFVTTNRHASASRPLVEERTPDDQTASADLGDLRAALAARQSFWQRDRRVLRDYEATRAALSAWRDALSAHRQRLAWDPACTNPPPAFTPPAVPAGLPAEFDDYVRGAILFYQGNGDLARRAWADVLERPPAERVFRSTWAAFMTGKSLLCDHRPGEAIIAFRQVRKLAADGFVDSLDLAAASAGWEARAELDLKHYSRAIELYMARLERGDPTAIASLQFAAQAALQAPVAELAGVVSHALARRVLTAYILSQGGPFGEEPSQEVVDRFLEAVASRGAVPMADADRLAWAAYMAGRMERAQQWLELASPDAPVARWVRAKLLLRAGRLEQATGELAALVRTLPPSNPDRMDAQEWDVTPCSLALEPMENRVRGELGVLQLSRRQYAGALDLLARGGYWDDAAYVAESILTLDELKHYVDANWPAPRETVRAPGKPLWEGTPSVAERIRHLLARRLARAHRDREARPYLPAAWQPRLDAYAVSMARARDPSGSRKEQATGLWEAARIMRHDGMELFGTEFEPDWFVHGGCYEQGSIASAREAAARADVVAAVSADERNRAQRQRLTPARRFHYRYVALDLAWEAAGLMPDGSPETASVLCQAGTWIKDRDPQAADRFYKALVKRCGATPLGAEAARLRWFPPR